MSFEMPSSEFYKQRALQFKQEGERIEKRIRKYSWSRVALVLIMGFLIYAGFSQSYFFWLLIVPLLSLLRWSIASHFMKIKSSLLIF